MTPALIGLVLAVAALAGSIAYARTQGGRERALRVEDAERHRDEVDQLEQQRKALDIDTKEQALRLRTEVEAEIRERRAELARLEQKAAQREETFDRRRQELDQREARLGRREVELDELQDSIETERSTIGTELERIAALTQQEARAELL